jgi:flagellar hook protein FlgE
MSSALSIALSALQAQSEGINTTGNNLANMNTTGFKGSTADFEDLISQYMGVGAGQAVGTGVARPINQQLFTQGPLESSTSPLATAIQGNGFFVVNDPSSGSQYYTRDGNFKISDSGVLQTQTGQNVQGWVVSPNGTINTSTAPGDIALPVGAVLPPQTTKNMSLSANLNASTPVGNSWSTTINAVDSLGQTHPLTFTFTPTAANTWSGQVTIPVGDLAAGTPPATGGTTAASTTVTVPSTAGIAIGQSVSGAGIPANTTVTAIGAGTITLSAAATATAANVPLTFGTTVNLLSTPASLVFNSQGILQSASSTASPISLSFPAGDSLADSASIGNGGTMLWSLFDSNSGAPLITQFGTASSLSTSSQDGSQAAQLTSVAIQNGGSVVAQFSNGTQVVEAQLALAAIQNPDSLVNDGNNNFSTTAATSTPAVGLPQTGGRGQLLGGQLEGSNVDMATEFTHLITYQSAYQASSRVITTVNQMTQDLMNLIR